MHARIWSLVIPHFQRTSQTAFVKNPRAIKKRLVTGANVLTIKCHVEQRASFSYLEPTVVPVCGFDIDAVRAAHGSDLRRVVAPMAFEPFFKRRRIIKNTASAPDIARATAVNT
jgi:hypothetical protein